MKFRRRNSAGSSPAAAAPRSISRSTRKVASGRPAPRTASTGAVWVKVPITRTWMAPMSYWPDSSVPCR